jgi:hypothetical protein
MQHRKRLGGALAAAVIGSVLAWTAPASAQVNPDPNAAPNPYRLDDGWAKLPAGRKWGGTFGVSVDRSDGKSIWAFDRCEQATFCADSNLAPIFKFDPTGKMLANFGSGMFAAPHGLFVDRYGDVWTTDFQIKNGKGYAVTKFSPDGKVLMTLGKSGVAGDNDSHDLFNAPSNVLIAPDDTIFVADGHGEVNKQYTNARIVKFTKDGKFIKAWGHKGSGPGEFDTPHMMAMDSMGRLFVADRSNNRIQIFDQDVRPAERRLHQQERHHLCGRLHLERQDQSGLHAGHPRRQRERRQGGGLHPGDQGAQCARRRRRRRRGQYLWRLHQHAEFPPVGEEIS